MRYYLLVLVAIAYVAYVNSESCVQCHSGTDIKCATTPDVFMAKECNNLSSPCYTRVLDGHTIRGCVSDLDDSTASKCNDEMECVICGFLHGCNCQVFPAHRAQCLQCEGNSSSTCATAVYAQPSICPLYKLGARCYIRHTEKDHNKSFTRGCLLAAQAQNQCVDVNNCYTCEGKGCNDLALGSRDIPYARDSAGVFGYSVTLVLAFAVASRFF